MVYYIAVDIGGTQIRAARFRAGEIEPDYFFRQTTQHAELSPEENLTSIIQRVLPENGKVGAIGVASPGPLNLTTGVVIKAPNIPQWVNFPLVGFLQDRFKVPIYLDNDANLAALGEWKYGAGQGHKNLIYLTISTGIGGGIIIENRILHGENGLAAEIGHITVVPDGPPCSCGQSGHLEAVASGTAIANAAIRKIQNGDKSLLPSVDQISARMVADAANQGDSLSIQLLADAGHHIGRAAADLIHVFNPTAIIIGGGVSQSGDLIMNPIREGIKKYCMTPEYLQNLTVSTAKLLTEPGLIGALILAEANNSIEQSD